MRTTNRSTGIAIVGCLLPILSADTFGPALVYSGRSPLAGVMYFAPAGGALPSGTEAEGGAGIFAASGGLVSNFYVNLFPAPGTGNSVVFTWRHAGVSQALACAIANTATSCNDTTHSFTVATGDLIDIQVSVTGAIEASPRLLMSTQVGTIPAQGQIFFILSGSCPAGFSEVTALNGKTIIGTLAANGDVGTTGGSDTVTPAGTVAAPTFTGSSVTSSANSGGTPMGTVAAPTFTGTSGQSTSSDSAGTPAGTVAAPTFTGTSAQATSAVSAGTPAGTNGTAAFTPSGTIAWPVGVPAFSGSAGTVPAQIFTGSAGTVPAQIFTGSAGTVPAPTISWPAGVPSFAGSALGTHLHGAGTLADATSGTTVKLFTASGSGASAATLSGSTAAISAGIPAGTVAWPVGVPTNGTVSFTPAGTNGTASFTPAGTNGTAAFTPAGTVAWPAGVPAFSGSGGTVPAQTFTGSALGTHSHTLTPSGTNSAPAFTGSALGTHSHTITPAGTNSAPTFTGSALGTHSHTVTAAGTNSAPGFSGASFDNRSSFVKVIFCVAN